LEKRPEGDAASAEAEPDNTTMECVRWKGKGRLRGLAGFRQLLDRRVNYSLVLTAPDAAFVSHYAMSA
jgi:hypothetical protein